MIQKLLLFPVIAIMGIIIANGQTKLVEKVTKQADELVIPYEKYVLPKWAYADHS